MQDVLKLLRLVKGHIPAYVLAIVMLTIGTVSFLFIPVQIGQLVGALNEIMAGSSGSEVWLTIATISILFIVQAICSAIHAFVIANTSEKIINKLRVAFFSYVIAQPLDGGRTQTTGEMASEFASDLVIIQDGIADTLLSFLRNGLACIGAFVALLIISVKMTIIALVGISLITLVILSFIRLATRSIMSVQKYRAQTVSLLLEASSNAYVIQAYHRNDYMNKRFQQTIANAFKKVHRHLLLMSWVSPISLIVFAIVMGITMAYGVKEVAATSMTIEQFITYMTYTFLLVASVSQVGLLFGRMKQGAVMYNKHEKRFENDADTHQMPLKDTPEYAGATKTAQTVAHKSPLGIRINAVSFRYQGTELAALADINALIKAGEVTAIVGESGSGKSTLAGLLCGLFHPGTGTIELVDSRQNSLQAYPPPENCIAIVPQEPFVLSGSFAENIVFGRANISPQKVKEVAKLARIDDFIRGRLGGYDAQIQEAGNNLSRGQRQRIAIARALAGEPKVLLLDEATASLDVVSERAIKNLITELQGRVTVIIIAHQGQLLSDVDNLIMLKNGKIEFSGEPTRLEQGDNGQAAIVRLISDSAFVQDKKNDATA